MPEVQISRSDVDSLAEKLARLEPELSPSEQALLLCMLGVVVDVIDRGGIGEHISTLVSAALRDQSVPVVVTMTDPVPSIEEEFARAFTPGAAERIARRCCSIGVPAPEPPVE